MILFKDVPALKPEELAFLQAYFRRTGDRESLIWSLSPVRFSRFLQGSIDVGHGKERYRIIDQFGGRQPIILNHNFLVNGVNEVFFMPTLLLDSNVMSYLHDYVTGGLPLRISRRGFATRDLIAKFISLG